MSLSSFFSSFLSVVHNDAPEEKPQSKEEEQESKEEKEPEAEAAAEEAEEEEPEDVHPAIREECEQSSKCAPLRKHFQHCQEKVQNGQGFKHEDCVEELFHLMHCADDCAAPKLFSKLR